MVQNSRNNKRVSSENSPFNPVHPSLNSAFQEQLMLPVSCVSLPKHLYININSLFHPFNRNDINTLLTLGFVFCFLLNNMSWNSHPYPYAKLS